MAPEQTEVKKHVPPGGETPYAITLPCPPEEFSDFISGLLGRAQTIERVFRGTFFVARQQIEDTYHLVDQRVRQQNEANLIQFTVKILYSDESSILLNNLQDFLLYKEVRPLISVGAELTWTYLIRFQDKKYPERQVIDVSVRAAERWQKRPPVIILALINDKHESNRIKLAISHTARSWGTDMESLMTGHIIGWLREDPPLKRFVVRHSLGIAFAIWLLVMATCIAVNSYQQLQFVEARKGASTIVMTGPVDAAQIGDRLNFLIKQLVINPKDSVDLQSTITILVTLVVVTAIGFWILSAANNPPRSYVLLSAKADEQMKANERRREKNWILFGCSVLAAITAGVISNIIFHYLAKHWQL